MESLHVVFNGLGTRLKCSYIHNKPYYAGLYVYTCSSSQLEAELHTLKVTNTFMAGEKHP